MFHSNILYRKNHNVRANTHLMQQRLFLARSQILEAGNSRLSCAEFLCLRERHFIFHELIKSLSLDIFTFDFLISCSNNFFYMILPDIHTLFFYCEKIMTSHALFSHISKLKYHLISHCVEAFSCLSQLFLVKITTKCSRIRKCGGVSVA